MPLSFGKANSLDVFSELPLKGFHQFSKPGSIKLDTKNGPVQIVGIPWPTRHNLITKDQHRSKDSDELTCYIAQQVGSIIQKLASELDPTIPAVLAAHLTVSSGVFSGSEKKAVFGTDPTLLPSQLAIEPFDYVALGHLHRHQNLNKNGKIPVVYSGSIEAIDFGEIRDQKGYCSVTIESNQGQEKSCELNFVHLPTRKMIKIEHIIDPKQNQTDQLIEKIEKEDIKDAIIKISYHVPPGEPDRVNLAKIQLVASKAAHIAAIIPIHTPPEKLRRATLNKNMAMDELLQNYFKSKDLDAKKITALLAKAKKLEEAVDSDERVKTGESASIDEIDQKTITFIKPASTGGA
jgi:DNA repair protein SbcD/Mre11